MFRAIKDFFWLKKNRPAKRKNYLDTGEVIFHGGCIGCESQEHYKLGRCKGCQYFKANWNLPDLRYTTGDSPEEIAAKKEIEKRRNKIDSILN